MTKMVFLEDIAKVSLGYKSLQNDFFYLNRATIDTYKIEDKYLTPVYMLSDLNSAKYRQNPKVKTWLFECRDKKADLNGTGALSYINTMTHKTAAKKKQSAGTSTMAEVLKKQGGGLWYAPKAKPHPTRLWLRKAFNTVYAPFIFDTDTIVDQRCNYLDPKGGLDPELLGAVVTSSLFSYALEINGSASLGAGALEAPTSKLRRYLVFDPRSLLPAEQKKLVELARAVWVKETPPDWSAKGAEPGKELRALDVWLLKQSESGLTVEQLYKDLRLACAARITVAEDKVKKTNKKKVESLTTVAKGIVDQVRPLLNSRSFPENFGPESRPTFPVVIERSALQRIHLEVLLGHATLTVSGEGKKELFKGTFDLVVAESVVRSILLGRENFQVPSVRDDAEAAVAEFFKWFDGIRKRVDAGINESAFGTGYEVRLREEVYHRLNIHPLTGERILPPEIVPVT